MPVIVMVVVSSSTAATSTATCDHNILGTAARRTATARVVAIADVVAVAVAVTVVIAQIGQLLVVVKAIVERVLRLIDCGRGRRGRRGSDSSR